ncbi:MAG: substrate-binding domain-containing protein [Fuerstiella sp.]|nr:substrate-binding domain-containing protein [Fuerstiella sp.]
MIGFIRQARQTGTIFRVTSLVSCLLLLGCADSEPLTGDRSDSSATSAGESLRIGMMPKLMGISFFDATGRGAKEAAAELGVELIYDGPTESRSEDQIRMLDGWVAQGFDVIAVAPNDPDGVARTLKNAQEAGVTVVTWDTDANPQTSKRPIFVNQCVPESIGYALTDVMAEGIKRRGGDLAGDYLIVSGTATAANQNVWMEFMRRRIEEKYPEIKLLEPLYPGEDHQKSQEQAAEAVAANPDIKGIWGITSVSLPAVAKVVRDAGKAQQIFVTGLSLPNTMREYVKDGTIDEFVLFSPVDLGYLTVHVARRMANGGLEPGTYDFGRLKEIEVRDGQAILGPPLIFSQANIDDFDF